MKLSYQVFVLIWALSTSCSGKSSDPESTFVSQGPRIDAVNLAAEEFGLDPRVIMVTAFTQTQLGELPTQTARLTDESPLGPSGSASNDFQTQVRGFAKSLAARAKDTKPQNYFDWYVQSAQVLVGSNKEEPAIRDTKLRIALLELIHFHNNGFSVYLGADEGTTVAPADDTQRIQFQSLDAGQARYLGNFKFSSDFSSNSYVSGNASAIAGFKTNRKTPSDPVPADLPLPQLIINWCPYSTLECFESLRTSENQSTHLFSYRGRNGEREIVQFHDLNSDLKNFTSARTNSIILTLSGFAGSSNKSANPAWFDWEDYASVRQTILSVQNQVTREWGRALLNPEEIAKSVVTEQPNGTSLLSFSLPTYWDATLFRELLNITVPVRIQSRVRIDSPTEGASYAKDSVPLAFYPDPETTEVQIFQDTENATWGNGWDLIEKRDLSSANTRIEYTRDFRRNGAQGNNIRAIKIVCRNAAGVVIGSRVVRFKVTNSDQ